jgi:hypothetical protein
MLTLALLAAVSPGVAGRSLITFFLLMTLPISALLNLAWREGGLTRMCAIASIAATVWFGYWNSERNFTGYMENAQAHYDNDTQLRKAALEYRQHIGPGSVTLFRLPNPYFAEKMPYDRPLIERWIRKYYGLPEACAFAYTQPSPP